jgi:hypothetical protein
MNALGTLSPLRSPPAIRTLLGLADHSDRGLEKLLDVAQCDDHGGDGNESEHIHKDADEGLGFGEYDCDATYMRLFIMGGTGALGRPFLLAAEVAGHNVVAPPRKDLDLFDPKALVEWVHEVDAIFHPATRIGPLELIRQPAERRENDRLRAEASRLLVDAALITNVEVYVQPTVTFLYSRHGPADEERRLGRYMRPLRPCGRASDGALRRERAPRGSASIRTSGWPRHLVRGTKSEVRRDAPRGRRRGRALSSARHAQRYIQRLSGWRASFQSPV